MKIAIISDTHDNLPNFEKAIEYVKKNGIENIIHCGDVCDPDTLKNVLKNFKGVTFVTVGNMDGNRFVDKTIFEDFPCIKIYYEFGDIELDYIKIAFTHLPERAKELSLSGKYDLVFYGHTHKPWEEKIKEARMINPGNLSGTFYKATFAVYDTTTDKLELKILERL